MAMTPVVPTRWVARRASSPNKVHSATAVMNDAPAEPSNTDKTPRFQRGTTFARGAYKTFERVSVPRRALERLVRGGGPLAPGSPGSESA